MNLLSKDMILAATDLKTEDVACPEWSGTVRVSEMSGEAYAEYLANAFPENDGEKQVKARRFSAVVVACCVVDEAGARVFSVEDAEALARKSRKALDRVFDAADRLNLLTPRARETAEKN
jgi:hypothetical protein